jgi:hypothetical protein
VTVGDDIAARTSKDIYVGVSSIKFIHSAKNIQRRLNIKTPTAVLREL